MHQVADRGCVFRGTDGIVAHHAFETLHGPRSMEGENFVEKGFAVGMPNQELWHVLLECGVGRLRRNDLIKRLSASASSEVADVAMARIEAASRGATPTLSALINVVWSVCVCVELA